MEKAVTTKVERFSISCSDELMDSLIYSEKLERIKKLKEDFQRYFDGFSKLLSEQLEKSSWVEIHEPAVYVVEDGDNYVLFLDPKRHTGLRTSYPKQCGKYEMEIPNIKLLERLVIGKQTPLIDNGWLFQSEKDMKEYGNTNYMACYEGNYEKAQDTFKTARNLRNWGFSDVDVLKVPTNCIKKENRNHACFLLSEGLRPTAAKNGKHILLFNYAEEISCEEGKISFHQEFIDKILEEQDNYQEINGSSFRSEDILKDIKDQKELELEGEGLKVLEKELAECDTRRNNRDPYAVERLYDPNEGHWELWSADAGKETTEDEEEKKSAKRNTFTFCVSNGMYARNPVVDIFEDGIVGIDFGTKSTIVTKLDENSEIRQMRVGRGSMKKGVRKGDYENPTIMEFCDIESFMKRYQAKKGRPYTEWDMLSISHEAESDFRGSTENENYYAFFSDIKQWCSDSSRIITIRDKKKNEEILPDFLKIEEDAFNPVEIYAYYLGLFINNMENKIYLRYILSYPVNYDKAVREKIRDSFERGIKKSLPEEVLNDEEAMEQFSVTLGASEPAAYAICALNEFHFQPEEEKPVFYGIFDFGGGTTDFDYGLWKKLSTRRYTREIEHFASGGVKYLGGENLLEQMAYETFKLNQDKLREEEIKFFRPAECKPFEGDEALVGDSQYARRNIRQLAEELRCYWEDPDIVKRNEDDVKTEEPELTEQERKDLEEFVFEEAEKKNILKAFMEQEKKDAAKESSSKAGAQTSSGGQQDGNSSPDGGAAAGDPSDKEKIDKIYDGKIHVNLFKEDAGMMPLELKVDEPALRKLLEKKIKQGVENFFLGVENSQVKEKLEGISEMKIFLAGNSCKSPLVKKAFDEEIKKPQMTDAEKQPETKTNVKKGFSFNDKKITYEIIPPLGSDAAKEYIDNRKNEFPEDFREDFEKPTGKTGVAYGLLLGRKGSGIKVVDESKAEEEAKFRYYLGYNRNSKFEILYDRDAIVYGKWYEIIEADEEETEILFTSLPEAATNEMPANRAKRKAIRISKTYDDAKVFISPTAPSKIQYAVARTKEDTEEKNFLEEPKDIELKE